LAVPNQTEKLNVKVKATYFLYPWKQQLHLYVELDINMHVNNIAISCSFTLSRMKILMKCILFMHNF